MNGHGGGLHLHKDVDFMNTVKNQKFMVQIGVCDGLTLASAPYTGHPWFSALANLDLFLMGAQASLNFIIEPLKNTIVTIITYFTSIFWHLLMVYFVSLSYNENKVKCSLFLMPWCYIALTRCGFLVINTTRLLLVKRKWRDYSKYTLPETSTSTSASGSGGSQQWPCIWLQKELIMYICSLNSVKTFGNAVELFR